MSKTISIKNKLNVLIIDDNEQITKMLSTFLKLSHCQCSIANDGQYGLELLQNNDFDVTILDLAMPDVDGYEILDKLTNSNILSKIIILTASNITNENMARVKKKGISVILQKPIDIDVLLEKILSISQK